MKKVDFYTAIFGIIFSLFLIWYNSRLDIAIIYTFDPRVWPGVILLLLLSLSILLLLQSFKHQNNEKREQDITLESLYESYETHFIRTYAAMILCFLSSLLLLIVGFFILVPIFLSTFMYILGVRTIKRLVMIPIIVTISLGILFTRIVYIPFPKGIGVFYVINVLFY